MESPDYTIGMKDDWNPEKVDFLEEVRKPALSTNSRDESFGARAE